MQVSHVTPQRMRTVLGHFCSGITVITAMSQDRPVGFTCQSFSSLSLDPPLVTFSPACTSTTWPKIRDVGTFAINVLAAHHDAVSNGFARSGSDKFAGVKWSRGALGAPILDDVVAWAECRLWAEYDGGDHTIVAAEVLDLHADSQDRPLLYFQGGYHLPHPHYNNHTGQK
jgi:3-hydroxy-9,10-secoandrosta-1,3,5(10)-triene-9,17-dione monooxygenase reductase component